VVRAAAVAMRRRGKHISASKNLDTTIEELCFLCGPWRGVTNETTFKAYSESVARVEAGSNTSTVALRVVGGDEKRIQWLEE
jgi:hypothetical protein